MKIIQIQKYQCDICSASYGTAADALKCESKPVSQDKGVKVGDVVIITAGDGKGEKATVETRLVFDMDWGHYAWERYWHTVGLTVKLNQSVGSRVLNFDSYKTVAASP